MQSVLQVVFLTGQLTFLIKLGTNYAGNLIMPKFLQIIISYTGAMLSSS